MTLAATYDPVLGRIRLAGTFLSPAVYAVFDRTVDGVRYTTVRGGARVDVSGQNANADDYEFPPGVPITYRLRAYSAADALLATSTATITQDLDRVWLKVPAAPVLNRPVIVVERSAVGRRARRGVFDVPGRTLPVVVGDLASGLEYTLQLLTATAAEERDVDYLFASGEIVLVQLPSTVEHFPGGYYSVGDVSRTPTTRLSARRIWEVPLTEAAAPGPEVVGSAYTIASMLAEYATVTAVIAGNATIADLLQRTGTPADVVVP
jgi:hypothetical protein